MNLPDTNIWFALSLSTHLSNGIAHKWLAQQSAPGSIFFCRATQQSFLRLITTESIMRHHDADPVTNHAAWAILEKFLADPRITFMDEPPVILSHWKRLSARATASPKLWMDAYLAAFALAANLDLVTTDHAFTQFQGLKTRILK